VQARLEASQDPAIVGPLASFLASAEGRKITGKVFALRRGLVSMLPPPVEIPLAQAASGTWDVAGLVEELPKVVQPGLAEVFSPGAASRAR